MSMENLEQKINALELKMEHIADNITAGFDLISARLDMTDRKLNDIKGGSTGNLGTVEKTLSKGFAEIIEELKKINHVTRYSEIANNVPGKA